MRSMIAQRGYRAHVQVPYSNYRIKACLFGLAQGKYYYLPNANDAAIAMAASSAMAEAKAA